jgi:hypothetical protein
MVFSISGARGISVELLSYLVEIVSYSLQLAIGLLIQNRDLWLEQSFFKDDIPDDLSAALVGVAHQLYKHFLFPFSHPKGESSLALFFCIYCRSCHTSMNKVNRNFLRVAEASVLVLPKHGLLLTRGGQNMYLDI